MNLTRIYKRKAQGAKRKTAGQGRCSALCALRSNAFKALAPAQIRAALHSGAMNLCAENGHDLEADDRWRDEGDLAIPAGDEAALATITGAAAAILTRGGRLLALGGDHAVSFPLLHAYGEAHPGLTVLHIDAHPDLYDELDGDRQEET